MAADAITPDSRGGAALVPSTSANGHKRALSQAEHRQRSEAALKHGLYARSPEGSRKRQYRAGRLTSKLLDAFADHNRPLSQIQVPAARAWAQLEVLASDAYSAIMAGEGVGGDKLITRYLAIRRQQLPYAAALGMTPASETGLAKEFAQVYRLQQAAEAQARAQQYSPSSSAQRRSRGTPSLEGERDLSPHA